MVNVAAVKAVVVNIAATDVVEVYVAVTQSAVVDVAAADLFTEEVAVQVCQISAGTDEASAVEAVTRKKRQQEENSLKLETIFINSMYILYRLRTSKEEKTRKMESIRGRK